MRGWHLRTRDFIRSALAVHLALPVFVLVSALGSSAAAQGLPVGCACGAQPSADDARALARTVVLGQVVSFGRLDPYRLAPTSEPGVDTVQVQGRAVWARAPDTSVQLFDLAVRIPPVEPDCPAQVEVGIEYLIYILDRPQPGKPFAPLDADAQTCPRFVPSKLASSEVQALGKPDWVRPSDAVPADTPASYRQRHPPPLREQAFTSVAGALLTFLFFWWVYVPYLLLAGIVLLAVLGALLFKFVVRLRRSSRS